MVVHPFRGRATNELIGNASYPEANVSAVIILTSELMIANEIIKWPPIISFLDITMSSTVRMVAFNKNPEQPQDWFRVTVTHTFIERCEMIMSIIPIYHVIAAFWFVVTLAYGVYTFVLKK